MRDDPVQLNADDDGFVGGLMVIVALCSMM